MNNEITPQIIPPQHKKEYTVRVYEKQVELKIAYVFVEATSEDEAREEVRKAFARGNPELWKQIEHKLEQAKWLPTEMGDKGVI